MQNCLHSRKRIPKRRSLLQRVEMWCLIIIFVMVLVGKNNVKYEEQIPYSMYLGLKNEHVEQTVGESDAGDGKEMAKMNNELDENSNFASDVTKKEIGTVICAKISVLERNGGIVSMDMEEYVLGCLIGEMPLSFHPQALMAQSIAIRSFTAEKTYGTSKHKNAHACMNPACCQNYISPSESGYNDEMLEKARLCVNATKNIIAVYDGKAINAVYHASSPDSTKDSKAVWGGDVEYLKAVKSPDGEYEICVDNYGGRGGHGVGMSQQGANLLAKEGYSYADILKYYYSGITFEIMVNKNAA